MHNLFKVQKGLYVLSVDDHILHSNPHYYLFTVTKAENVVGPQISSQCNDYNQDTDGFRSLSETKAPDPKFESKVKADSDSISTFKSEDIPAGKLIKANNFPFVGYIYSY